MSGKLITAKIDVKKIKKELLFKGTKGLYLDLIIWINPVPDKYGNEVSIQQRTKKGEPALYIGEGKFYVKKQEEPPQGNGEYVKEKTQIGAMSDINQLPGATDENPDKLPF